MKILIDLSFVRYDFYTGVSKYAFRILDYIKKNENIDDYTILVSCIFEDKIRKLYPEFKIIRLGNSSIEKLPIVSTMINSLLFKNIINKLDVDLVFCPWGNGINFKKINKTKITTVHDIQMQIDLNGVAKLKHKLTDSKVLKNSDQIITISEFSKKQILKYYPSFNKPILNFSNVVDMPTKEEFKGVSTFSRRYILSVGRLTLMKNTITLLKAYHELKMRGNIKDFPLLVLVGRRNLYWDEDLSNYIRNFELDNDVILIEQCSDDELNRLYANASLFVCPSKREGFGFPPIEAALMDIPVISTKCDSLLEVTFGKLNYYEAPDDAIELCSKIETLILNPPNIEDLVAIRIFFKSKYSSNVICKRIVDFLKMQ